jgi:hypothetical protein
LERYANRQEIFLIKIENDITNQSPRIGHTAGAAKLAYVVIEKQIGP